MDKNVKEKTQVFNVIILDKSGSMGSIREAAVSGFNETLAKDCSTRMNLFKKVHHFREMNMDGAMSEADIAQNYCTMADEAFDEEGA